MILISRAKVIMKNTYSLRYLVFILLILNTSVIYADQESAIYGKPGTTYSWMPSGTFFYDAARFRDSDIKSLLENSIISEIKTKGYTFAASDTKADFYISYIVILEEKLSDSEITNILKDYPDINQADTKNNNFEHGTFIISASAKSDRKKIWSNSLNEFVYLNMPQDIRQQRLQEGTKNILESFPILEK